MKKLCLLGAMCIALTGCGTALTSNNNSNDTELITNKNIEFITNIYQKSTEENLNVKTIFFNETVYKGAYFSDEKYFADIYYYEYQIIKYYGDEFLIDNVYYATDGLKCCVSVKDDTRSLYLPREDKWFKYE